MSRKVPTFSKIKDHEVRAVAKEIYGKNPRELCGTSERLRLAMQACGADISARKTLNQSAARKVAVAYGDILKSERLAAEARKKEISFVAQFSTMGAFYITLSCLSLELVSDKIVHVKSKAALAAVCFVGACVFLLRAGNDLENAVALDKRVKTLRKKVRAPKWIYKKPRLVLG